MTGPETPVGQFALIVAGSRRFDNYQLLENRIKHFTADIANNPNRSLHIITGGARGADTLGREYATRHHLPHTEILAQWDTQGRSAGYRRNQQMAAIADGLIAFWDGHSAGTRQMIDIAQKLHLPTRIVRYQPATTTDTDTN